MSCMVGVFRFIIAQVSTSNRIALRCVVVVVVVVVCSQPTQCAAVMLMSQSGMVDDGSVIDKWHTICIHMTSMVMTSGYRH